MAFDFNSFVGQNESLLLFGGIASLLWMIVFPKSGGVLGSTGVTIGWISSIGLTGLGLYALMLNQQHSVPAARPVTHKAHYASVNGINPYYPGVEEQEEY